MGRKNHYNHPDLTDVQKQLLKTFRDEAFAVRAALAHNASDYPGLKAWCNAVAVPAFNITSAEPATPFQEQVCPAPLTAQLFALTNLSKYIIFSKI